MFEDHCVPKKKKKKVFHDRCVFRIKRQNAEETINEGVIELRSQ